jgi:hypothetical protein
MNSIQQLIYSCENFCDLCIGFRVFEVMDRSLPEKAGSAHHCDGQSIEQSIALGRVVRWRMAWHTTHL